MAIQQIPQGPFTFRDHNAHKFDINRLRAIANATFTASDLARNPQLNTKLAGDVASRIVSALGPQNFPKNGKTRLRDPEPFAVGTRIGFGVGGISQFEFDFKTATDQLRSEFVTFETERQFGPQGVTSQTTAGGNPIAGQVQSRTPTANELTAIERSFISPIDRARQGLPSGPQTARSNAAVQARRPNPTAVSGQGIRRTRARGGSTRGTLLTGDDGLGDRTLLG